jgi:hypothetical protein
MPPLIFFFIFAYASFRFRAPPCRHYAFDCLRHYTLFSMFFFAFMIFHDSFH